MKKIFSTISHKQKRKSNKIPVLIVKRYVKINHDASDSSILRGSHDICVFYFGTDFQTVTDLVP